MDELNADIILCDRCQAGPFVDGEQLIDHLDDEHPQYICVRCRDDGIRQPKCYSGWTRMRKHLRLIHNDHRIRISQMEKDQYLIPGAGQRPVDLPSLINSVVTAGISAAMQTVAQPYQRLAYGSTYQRPEPVSYRRLRARNMYFDRDEPAESPRRDAFPRNKPVHQRISFAEVGARANVDDLRPFIRMPVRTIANDLSNAGDESANRVRDIDNQIDELTAANARITSQLRELANARETAVKNEDAEEDQGQTPDGGDDSIVLQERFVVKTDELSSSEDEDPSEEATTNTEVIPGDNAEVVGDVPNVLFSEPNFISLEVDVGQPHESAKVTEQMNQSEDPANSAAEEEKQQSCTEADTGELEVVHPKRQEKVTDHQNDDDTVGAEAKGKPEGDGNRNVADEALVEDTVENAIKVEAVDPINQDSVEAVVDLTTTDESEGPSVLIMKTRRSKRTSYADLIDGKPVKKPKK